MHIYVIFLQTLVIKILVYADVNIFIYNYIIYINKFNHGKQKKKKKKKKKIKSCKNLLYHRKKLIKSKSKKKKKLICHNKIY